LKRRPSFMHITDVSHFLDNTGAIGPKKGPTLVFAQFQTSLVAHASRVKGRGELQVCRI
jgi:hypothetical protein